MPEPYERLRDFKDELGLQSAQMADAIGVSRAVWSDWENGKTAIRRPNALALQAVYGINSDWLLTGEGPMKATPIFGGGFSRHAEEIPLLEGLPTCGPGGEIQDPGPERTAFPTGLLDAVLKRSGAGTKANLYAMRVAGHSMAPDIEDGDTVIINNALALRQPPFTGASYLVRLPGSGEAVVKRAYFNEGADQLALKPVNPAYLSKTIPVEGLRIHDLILGRVVWASQGFVRQGQPED